MVQAFHAQAVFEAPRGIGDRAEPAKYFASVQGFPLLRIVDAIALQYLHARDVDEVAHAQRLLGFDIL